MPVTTEKRSRQGPKTVWAERLRRQVPARYELDQDTVVEIAEALRVTEKTVAGILAIPVRERRLHDVGVLHRRGVGRVEIAHLLRLKPRTISDYLFELQRAGEIDSAACPHCGR